MNDRRDSLSALPLRENLRGKSPYGAPQKSVPFALNVNENTHPLPEAVQETIVGKVASVVGGLNRYPDRDAVELRSELADYLNAQVQGIDLAYENVWAANGSNEILQQILQTFGGPGRALLSFTPTYSMYPLLAAGTDTDYVAGTRGSDFSLTQESALEQLAEAEPAVVFLASPNNPTATALGPDVIEALYEASEPYRTMIVVDEAYAEFARDSTRSALRLLKGRERLIVTRTMSKAFGLAGARLGYLAAAPHVVDALQLVRLPYHLSAVTQAVALGALAHAEDLLATVDDIRAQRDRIEATLRELGFSPAVSDANFVFFTGVRDSQALFEALLDDGILIRDVGIPNSLRVSAGTREETDAFLTAMRRLAPEHVLPAGNGASAEPPATDSPTPDIAKDTTR
ncbi:histidinol-phosphate transaminase [Falsarthrobacter nasiphocae]|uniref:Histidinol-phosphate aminotransferase n=1 Tax=Falsarthrobacter nasiphocae TaxID=189863 RepID=A0AAE3YF53_9MICC|nr:histidinol-phosphate transaminase [Falsarthrobacter nasiphocae]MDR6892683.1 histidinol-phosphate aminotransferase [Falsarthrobacter nasiphocae]